MPTTNQTGEGNAAISTNSSAMNQLNLLPFDLIKEIRNDTGKKLPNNTLQALKLLASLGLNREFLALLLELAEFRVDHIRYCAGPLVFHRTPWTETVPDWLKAACLQDRFESIIDEHERAEVGESATATEVLAYMMPATYEAPLHYSYFNIYAWCFDKVMTKHGKLPEQWSSGYEFLNMSPIEFESIKYDYNDLSRSIRRSVVRHAAQQGWGKRRTRKNEAKPVEGTQPLDLDKSSVNSSAPNQPSEVQLKLF